jgi:hypothetical protein
MLILNNDNKWDNIKIRITYFVFNNIKSFKIILLAIKYSKRRIILLLFGWWEL